MNRNVIFQDIFFQTTRHQTEWFLKKSKIVFQFSFHLLTWESLTDYTLFCVSLNNFISQAYGSRHNLASYRIKNLGLHFIGTIFFKSQLLWHRTSDWLIVWCFTLFSQYSSHITAILIQNWLIYFVLHCSSNIPAI